VTEREGSATPPAGDATLDAPPGTAGELPPVQRPLASRYRIDGELARGGLGRVLLAFDHALGRPVALKTLLVDTPLARARFAREAAFTAKLQHPAIVPIYEAGVDDHGVPFHAMPLVSGVTLQAAIARTRTLDERLALLPSVQSVADAIAYAHSRGVIHRDIKPANVLIGPFGETVVIDWGVAKSTSEVDDPSETTPLPEGLAADLTAVGSVVGTPAYMAPEQARGDPVSMGIDVYALGALLYHVLAGAPPLAGDEGDILTRRRQGEAPPPLAGRVPGLPLDLERIVRKAMSLDPGARYATAAGLADDLRRFQTGQLISAHEYGRWELVRRWLRRHAGAVLAGVTVLGTVGAMAGYAVNRIMNERDRAREARREAVTKADALILAHADSERMRDPTAAAAWLESYPAVGKDPERRFELALATTAEPVAWTALRHEGDEVFFGTLGLPGDRAITFGWDETVVWSIGQAGVSPPEPVWRARQESPVKTFAVLSDEAGPTQYVAAGDQSGGVAVLDTLSLTRQPLTRLSGPIASIVASASSPVFVAKTDSALVRLSGPGWAQREDHAVVSTLAVVARDGGTIFAAKDALWRWPMDAPPTTLTSGLGAITALALNPRADEVYTGSASGELVRARFGAGGARNVVLRRFASGVTALALGPDGRDLVVGDKAGQVWLVDSTAPDVATPLFRHSEAVAALAFQPGARTVASTSSDGKMAMWSLATGASRVFRGHETLIGPISFTVDGRLVSTTGMDGVVRVWPVVSLSTARAITRLAPATHAAFSDDGRYVVSDGDNGSVIIVDLESGRRREERVHAGRAYGVEAVGSVFVSAGYDGLAVVWDVVAGSHEVYSGHEGRVRKAQLGPEAKHVYTAGNDGTVRRFDRSTRIGEILQRFDGRVLDLEVLAAERVLLAVGNDGTLQATSLEDGVTRNVASGLGAQQNGAFELGRVGDEAVLVCRGTGRIERYGAEGTLEGGWDVEGPVNCTRLSGHGWRVAFTTEYTVWVMDRDGRAIRIGQTSEAIHAMTLGGSGDVVATASLDGAVTVWRLDAESAELRDAAIVARHDGAAFGVSLSKDGRRLASAGFDGHLRIVDLAETKWVPRAAAAIGPWLGALTTWRVNGATAMSPAP
jgi:WD40 repeat protein